MKASEALSQAEVLDTEGRPVSVGSLWSERPVALIFVRHFG